jgi:hypothetical protein
VRHQHQRRGREEVTGHPEISSDPLPYRRPGA